MLLFHQVASTIYRLAGEGEGEEGSVSCRVAMSRVITRSLPHSFAYDYYLRFLHRLI